MKALEITPTSWTLYDDRNSKVGILVKKLKKYSLLTTEGVIEFKNHNELVDEFGDIKFKEREVVENKSLQVAGLPVEAEEVFDVDEESKIPSFKKTKNGKARYAPGYWGLKYSEQFVPNFCPKINTLENYEHIGPFKNKFIMSDEINQANKRLNNESPSDS